MKLVCNKCREHGLGFYAEHIQPHEYIEGNPNADIWIIGLNPKNEIGTVEARTLKQFQDFDPDCHPYFSDFAKVSGKLYLNWQSENSNIAHTDLVKCFSNSFPPAHNANRKGKKIIADHVVNNCSEHLQNQIRIGKPKLLICNGSTVCREIMRLFPPQMENYNPKTITSYQASQIIDGIDHHFWIVLSGFIGRIDDRNKRRLGKEIEGILEREGIELR